MSTFPKRPASTPPATPTIRLTNRLTNDDCPHFTTLTGQLSSASPRDTYGLRPTPQYAPLLDLSTELEYRHHWNREVCVELVTFDAFTLDIRRPQFSHIATEAPWPGAQREFSKRRAERMPWIKPALQDDALGVYQGYEHGSYTLWRRVVIAPPDYVVVIELVSSEVARLSTAYVADDDTVRKIQSGPPWSVAEWWSEAYTHVRMGEPRW